MCLNHEGMSKIWVSLIQNLGYMYTAILILEMILKMIGFGLSYFKNNWNKFDFFVVIVAIFDIILNNINN